MARKFITERELAFIDKINKELIQAVTGQEVNYFAISTEKSSVHKLYDEAVNKVWDAPVKINARVMWNNETTQATSYGLDSKYSCEVYFHKLELQERNVEPKEGDFIEFGKVYFEITSVTQPQIVFGQVNNRLMVKCMCVPSREGQFQNGNSSSENIDNSYDIENTKHKKDHI